MTDLIEFLEARLAEDEMTALRAGHDWPEWTYDRETFTVTSGGWLIAARKDEQSPINDVDGEHIARHDPARVLREVAAKRRLLALHLHHRYTQPLSADSPHEEDHRVAFEEAPRYVGCTTCHYDSRHEECYPSWWCDTVRLVAVVWSDHPDYRSEWTVDGTVVPPV